MGIEENKQIIKRFVEEVLSGDDISKVREKTYQFILDDYGYHGPDGKEIKGPEGFMHLAQIALTGFPDTCYTIESMLIELIVSYQNWLFGRF